MGNSSTKGEESPTAKTPSPKHYAPTGLSSTTSGAYHEGSARYSRNTDSDRVSPRSSSGQAFSTVMRESGAYRINAASRTATRPSHSARIYSPDSTATGTSRVNVASSTVTGSLGTTRIRSLNGIETSRVKAQSDLATSPKNLLKEDAVAAQNMLFDLLDEGDGATQNEVFDSLGLTPEDRIAIKNMLLDDLALTPENAVAVKNMFGDGGPTQKHAVPSFGARFTASNKVASRYSGTVSPEAVSATTSNSVTTVSSEALRNSMTQNVVTGTSRVNTQNHLATGSSGLTASTSNSMTKMSLKSVRDSTPNSTTTQHHPAVSPVPVKAASVNSMPVNVPRVSPTLQDVPRSLRAADSNKSYVRPAVNTRSSIGSSGEEIFPLSRSANTGTETREVCLPLRKQERVLTPEKSSNTGASQVTAGGQKKPVVNGFSPPAPSTELSGGSRSTVPSTQLSGGHCATDSSTELGRRSYGTTGIKNASLYDGPNKPSSGKASTGYAQTDTYLDVKQRQASLISANSALPTRQHLAKHSSLEEASSQLCDNSGKTQPSQTSVSQGPCDRQSSPCSLSTPDGPRASDIKLQVGERHTSLAQSQTNVKINNPDAGMGQKLVARDASVCAKSGGVHGSLLSEPLNTGTAQQKGNSPGDKDTFSVTTVKATTGRKHATESPLPVEAPEPASARQDKKRETKPAVALQSAQATSDKHRVQESQQEKKETRAVSASLSSGEQSKPIPFNEGNRQDVYRQGDAGEKRPAVNSNSASLHTQPGRSSTSSRAAEKGGQVKSWSPGHSASHHPQSGQSPASSRIEGKEGPVKNMAPDSVSQAPGSPCSTDITSRGLSQTEAYTTVVQQLIKEMAEAGPSPPIRVWTGDTVTVVGDGCKVGAESTSASKQNQLKACPDPASSKQAPPAVKNKPVPATTKRNTSLKQIPPSEQSSANKQPLSLAGSQRPSKSRSDEGVSKRLSQPDLRTDSGRPGGQIEPAQISEEKCQPLKNLLPQNENGTNNSSVQSASLVGSLSYDGSGKNASHHHGDATHIESTGQQRVMSRGSLSSQSSESLSAAGSQSDSSKHTDTDRSSKAYRSNPHKRRSRGRRSKDVPQTRSQPHGNKQDSKGVSDTSAKKQAWTRNQPTKAAGNVSPLYKRDGHPTEDVASKGETSQSCTSAEKATAHNQFGDSVEKKASTHNQSGDSAEKKATAHETTLYVQVHDVVEDIVKLGDLLTAKVDIEGVEFHPTETAITRSAGCTYCSVDCPSKALARRLRDLLLKDRHKFTPLIHCSFKPYQQDDIGKKNLQHDKERRQKEALYEIDSRSEKILRSHDQKLQEVQEKIEKAKANLHDLRRHHDIKQEIKALESKQMELLNQREEFSQAVQRFKAELGTVLEKDSFEREVNQLRRRFGVECSRMDKPLPVYARRTDVVRLVQDNQVCVIVAETGSGKSTQIVQYLLEAGFGKQGTIVCTQPRKVAAISLATHVSKEQASNVGQEMGYKVGSKYRGSVRTRLVFMTDHSLLNECLGDPDLRKFSCIVVDEAHERSLYTDLLLAMVKRCLANRPDLRVIITSATIDPQLFVTFFGGSCPVMTISGRTFPVQVVWQDADSEEINLDKYEDDAVRKAVEIHTKEPPGDVLVFLTSRMEIEKCCEAFEQKMKQRADFQCFPLHGQLQPDEQQKVFEPLTGNRRKIVFATNCAETSITIDGIRYVVDTGVAKELRYDARKNVNSLAVTVISRSSADQRKGRAGRTAPGTCYRLYSQRSFQAMEAISLPEILRTHLGQALLKLAELGVTPDMYDFVQAPSPDAITAALQSLHQLGALQDGVITDTGRWMARLPFDPKLGLLTLLGKEQGMLYDAVVLAAVISAGSGVLYRGSTPESQQKHDKAKARFSQTGGDFLTSLAVYREWQDVPEKQKGRWCMASSVNSKTMRGIRDNVNEVTQVLRKELKIDVGHAFSDAQSAPDALRKMVFRCYAANLCHYLGLERAGYFAAGVRRQVHFHPSCALNALASFPEWVVYDQILQTSRDFITGVTPVDTDWLQDITVQRFGIDMEQVRQKKVLNVHTQAAGSHAFFTLVGPRYSKMREYENQIAESQAVVVMEASRERGEVRVFSTESAASVQALIDTLTGTVQSVVKGLEEDDREMAVGREECGLRAVLGLGGQVQQIIMPTETRKVFILRPSPDATEESVVSKFRQFGDVTFWRQFPDGNNWGLLLFKSWEQATLAVSMTENDEFNAGQLERRRPAKLKAEFKAHLSWFRRPCKGSGAVGVSPIYLSHCLLKGHFDIGDKTVRMRLDRHKDDSLFLTGLPGEVTEEVVKRALLHRVVHDENAEDVITSVMLHRVKVGQTTQREVKKLENEIKEKFQRRLTASTVRVVIRKPDREERVMFSAEAYFTDPIEGVRACRALRGFSLSSGQRVEVTPVILASVFVQQRVLDACKAQYHKVIRHLRKRQMEVEEIPARGDTVRVSIKAEYWEDVVKARTFLTDVFKGDVLDCNASPAVQHLLTPAGRKFLQEAEKEAGAYVCVDNRLRTVAIHGTDQACTQARIKMNEYLDMVLSGTVEEVTLKGADNPPGVLKALITAHGDDLEGLRESVGLHAITVDYRRHKLKLTGNPDTLQKAKEVINKLKEELWEASKGEKPEEDEIECSACFCPVDTGDLYRLEVCAHPYCKGCIKRQVNVALTDHKLPVVCCYDSCDSPLAWRDFNNLSRAGNLSLPTLTTAAVTAYVMAHRDLARFCPTPDCPMVYRVSAEDTASDALSQDGMAFLCPECGVRTCTACHAQAHDGITCSMLRSSREQEKDVEAWALEDKKRRRVCPGCGCPIEKMYGCNKMICGACHTIFCWLCCKKFRTSGECYDHLSREHGGIFALDDLLNNDD